MNSKEVYNFFFNNFRYKLTAVFLSTVLWYIVQGEELTESNKNITVRIVTSNKYVVKGENIRRKDATLRGPRVLLNEYLNKDLEATIRIPAGRTGNMRFRIGKEFLDRWDERVKLTVHDPYVSLTVDEKMTKNVPIKEYIKGVPADDYMIEKTEITPKFVALTGLKSEVRAVKEILTEPIDVEGLQQTKSFEAKLVAPKGFSDDSLKTHQVKVNLLMGEKKINKRFRSVPVEVTGGEFLSNVTPRYVSIVIQGTPGVLQFIKTKQLRAFIDAADLSPGKQVDREIQVKIPPDTSLIEVFPENASIEVYNQKKLK